MRASEHLPSRGAAGAFQPGIPANESEDSLRLPRGQLHVTRLQRNDELTRCDQTQIDYSPVI
eukprot:1159491-Pelagomonas_calceolata.AAC.21